MYIRSSVLQEKTDHFSFCLNTDSDWRFRPYLILGSFIKMPKMHGCKSEKKAKILLDTSICLNQTVL